jgi:Baseplate J-like protein
MANNNGTADTLPYGVTAQGFVVKPFKAILDDAFTRARLLFGPDVDLRSSSTVRKLLELKSLEDALSWMQLDDVFHSGFAATASGSALDRLGTDLGRDRDYLAASGAAQFKLSASAPKDCVFTMPPGTLVETLPPAPGSDPIRFSLMSKLSLVKHDPPDGSEQAVAQVAAVTAGPGGNIATGMLVRLNATFASRYLSFDSSFIEVSNPAPFSDGDRFEDDSAYRRKLYALPRSLWTADAIRATVLGLDGVRDALVYDPYGGLDKAAPPFGRFCFNDENFQAARDLCNPYFLTITVAANPGVLWDTSGEIVGLKDEVLAAIQPIRPISIFPTVQPADIVEIALRARLTLAPTTDSGSVLGDARAAISGYIRSLRLGDPVLYAQLLRILAELSNVLNVQELHLRRCPPRFGEVTCGPPARFGNETDLAQIEAACGGDITLAPTEVAVFALDTPLMEIAFA